MSNSLLRYAVMAVFVPVYIPQTLTSGICLNRLHCVKTSVTLEQVVVWACHSFSKHQQHLMPEAHTVWTLLCPPSTPPLPPLTPPPHTHTHTHRQLHIYVLQYAMQYSIVNACWLLAV